MSFEIPYTVISNGFLDEELDVSPIEIKHTNDPDPFPRFCVAAIKVTESAAPRYWLVASDDVRTNVATGLSDHTVQLVEPTKWLERFMVGNKTVTQPKTFDYISNPVKAIPETVEGTTPGMILKPKQNVEYLSPMDYKLGNAQIPFYNAQSFTLNSNSHLVGIKDFKCEIELSNGETTTEIYHEDIGVDSFINGTPASDLILASQITNTADIITIRYTLTANYENKGKWSHRYGCQYKIQLLEASEYAAKGNTLKTAAFSMIKAAEILKDNKGNPQPRFSIKEETAQMLDEITSPELTVTNATLRESLDEVAKYIGSITRLDVVEGDDAFRFEVDFEKYCKDKQADLTELGDPCDIFKTASCEDYCTALDSTVSNLVQYEESGTIAEPGQSLYKTIRSEDASYRVTEGNGVISTAFPIERLDKAYIAIYVDGENGRERKVCDITKYIFESAEYSALSSYDTAYPSSKAYALCYTIGQKNITGLSFTCPSAFGGIFERPALLNIINREFGTSYSNWNPLDFTKILFHVKYVPTGSARIRMHKPNSFGMIQSTLAYNQSAAKIDAKAYGRAMFGAALRMGNVQTVLTFVAPPDAKVPEKGERYGENGFVAEIKEEIAPAQKTVTLTVAEGFNRLSQFVGVNKEHRIFEISERSYVDRHILYEDFCLVGTEEIAPDSKSMINTKLRDKIAKCFSMSEDRKTNFPPFAFVQGFDSVGSPLKKCFLPCIKYALGNALTFTVSFADNYGAGRKVEDSGKKDGFYSIESDVRYTDLFGRVDSMHLVIRDEIKDEVLKNMDEDDYISFANALPSMPANSLSFDGSWVNTEYGDNGRIHIDKDAREAIRTLTYQLSFLESNGIKISPYFAENVFDESFNSDLYLVPLDQTIDNLTEWVKVGKQIKADTVQVDLYKSIKVTFKVGELSSTTKSWAVVDLSDTKPNTKAFHRFLFGKNEKVVSGQEITVYFTFYH